MTSNYPPLTAAFLCHQTELRQFLVRRVNCSDTADDLLHDTFLHIANYPDQRQIANSRAFLYRVAGNLALDYLCGQARRQTWDGEELDDEWHCPSPPPERCLQGLPPANRQTLCLHRLDGKTHRQIAAELQVTERHVEYLLSRTGQLLVETGLGDGW